MCASIKVLYFIYSVSFSIIHNSQPEIFESVAERQEKGIKYITRVYIINIYLQQLNKLRPDNRTGLQSQHYKPENTYEVKW